MFLKHILFEYGFDFNKNVCFETQWYIIELCSKL